MRNALKEENKALRKQIESLTMLLSYYKPDIGFVSQRQAKRIYGVPWLAEKERDAAKKGLRLWVRTGSSVNSPKKYSLRKLHEIVEWERANGLPYDFSNEKQCPKLLEGDKYIK